MGNAELVALLREARECVVGRCNTGLRARIDAALAEHDAVPPSEETVETDQWWSPSSHRASEGRCDLHVWRMSLKEWGWSTTVYRDHERGREDLGSGVCNTLEEAKSAAIAAARGMR